jgi:hypothetical protein
MKSILRRFRICSIGILTFSLAFAGSVRSVAAVIDISNVSFNGFMPNPINQGAAPTSLSYSFDFADSSSGTVTLRTTASIILSPDSTFGDGNDIPIGSHLVTIQPPITGPSTGHSSITVSAPNGLSGFQIPPTTAPGEYFALLTLAPATPVSDPNTGNNSALFQGQVTVVPEVRAANVAVVLALLVGLCGLARSKSVGHVF